jgi:hypothetical protein
MDNRIKSALDKLDRHQGWSLTVAGFARRALKMKLPMSGMNRREARAIMVAAFGEPRRVPHDGIQVEVWDVQT